MKKKLRKLQKLKTPFIKLVKLVKPKEPEPEYVVPEGWQHKKPFQNSKKQQPTKIFPSKNKSQKNEKFSLELPIRKVRIPGLRRFKRVLAGILLIVNSFIGLIGLGTPLSLLSLLFVGNAFILLDYLWKTRRKKQL